MAFSNACFCFDVSRMRRNLAMKKRGRSNNLDLAFSYVNEFDLDFKKDTKVRVVKDKSEEIIDIPDPFGHTLNFHSNRKLWLDFFSYGELV